MKVAGFSFIRNAVKYDYPIIESIQSILPICDAFYIAVGASEDDTLELIESISSDKLHILPSVWDDSLREGGRVLAAETDKAFAAIPQDYDWAFYLQGDEVVHEEDLPKIQAAMQTYLPQAKVEGLLFKYRHFFGSYDYIADSRSWYRREIRIVRNDKKIFSYQDAQGFRKQPNEKLNVKLIDAHIYHYGWVKDPRTQIVKQRDFQKLWHSDEEISGYESLKAEHFDYSQIDSLSRFEGKHPQVIQERVSRVNWQFDHDISKKNLRLKHRLSQLVEQFTGWRIGEYRNYKLI